MLVTFGPNMKIKFQFDEARQKWVGQLAHLDAPARVEGVEDGEHAFMSAFVSMTDRSATHHFFDMSLHELLQGKTWSETSPEEDDWILRRLCFAHMAAFEMQQPETKKVSKAGSARFFDPCLRWHAGQEALEESTLPEVVLLFQFALEPIAPFYDRYFNSKGGFGQHAWDEYTAGRQLLEVQKNTYTLEEAKKNELPKVPQQDWLSDDSDDETDEEAPAPPAKKHKKK